MGAHPLEHRLSASGPKRILALDGGGVRGILTLSYLERIEQILGERYGNRDFRLSDYFDLIGGTSTGAIIASGLSLGKPVSELIDLYLAMSSQIFPRNKDGLGLFATKYRSRPLRQQLREELGSQTMGSTEIQTGLAIVAKRLDTGSTWIVHNNPNGRYYDQQADGGNGFPNKSYLVRQVVRASTAAPHYFMPEFIPVLQGLYQLPVTLGQHGAFVDGGVSPHNNPALLLFMMATIEGYNLNWEMGDDRLKIVSVGTGTAPFKLAKWRIRYRPAAWLASSALLSMMNDSDQLVQTMMQWMGSTDKPWPIDSEIGDLGGSSFGGQKFFRYSRYNVELSRDWLRDNLNEEYSKRQLKRLKRMDRSQSAPQLLELGRRAAELQVAREDFEAQFDIRSD